MDNLVYDVAKLQANVAQKMNTRTAINSNRQSPYRTKEILGINLNDSPKSPDEVELETDCLFPPKLFTDTDRSMVRRSKVTTAHPSEAKLSDQKLVDIKDMIDDIKE